MRLKIQYKTPVETTVAFGYSYSLLMRTLALPAATGFFVLHVVDQLAHRHVRLINIPRSEEPVLLLLLSLRLFAFLDEPARYVE